MIIGWATRPTIGRETFFSSLKKERIKKKIYRNREIAHADISEYIESFNQTRRHSHLGGVSPEDFEVAGKRRRRVH
jgi:putative transposase